MTDLGSIYGKKIDGSNTLVIDFSNVQINGTLNLADVTPAPYPAQHHAYFSLTSDFTVTNGGLTDLTSSGNSFTEITKLSNDISNNNNGTFTINTAGTYHIIYRMQMLSRASGSNFAKAQLRFKPNGSSTISTISECFSYESATSSYEVYIPFMINYLNSFAAGDVIHLSAVNNNYTYAISGQNGTNVRTSVSFVRIA